MDLDPSFLSLFSCQIRKRSYQTWGGIKTYTGFSSQKVSLISLFSLCSLRVSVNCWTLRFYVDIANSMRRSCIRKIIIIDEEIWLFLNILVNYWMCWLQSSFLEMKLSEWLSKTSKIFYKLRKDNSAHLSAINRSWKALNSEGLVRPRTLLLLWDPKNWP